MTREGPARPVIRAGSTWTEAPPVSQQTRFLVTSGFARLRVVLFHGHERTLNIPKLSGEVRNYGRVTWPEEHSGFSVWLDSASGSRGAVRLPDASAPAHGRPLHLPPEETGQEAQSLGSPGASKAQAVF